MDQFNVKAVSGRRWTWGPRQGRAYTVQYRSLPMTTGSSSGLNLEEKERNENGGTGTRRLGVNIPEVNKSGIWWEFIITASGYRYNKP